eukprot:jgi/Chlat1/2222/Chrsp17S02545
MRALRLPPPGRQQAAASWLGRAFAAEAGEGGAAAGGGSDGIGAAGRGRGRGRGAAQVAPSGGGEAGAPPLAHAGGGASRGAGRGGDPAASNDGIKRRLPRFRPAAQLPEQPSSEQPRSEQAPTPDPPRAARGRGKESRKLIKLEIIMSRFGQVPMKLYEGAVPWLTPFYHAARSQNVWQLPTPRILPNTRPEVAPTPQMSGGAGRGAPLDTTGPLPPAEAERRSQTRRPRPVINETPDEQEERERRLATRLGQLPQAEPSQAVRQRRPRQEDTARRPDEVNSAEQMAEFELAAMHAPRSQHGQRRQRSYQQNVEKRDTPLQPQRRSRPVGQTKEAEEDEDDESVQLTRQLPALRRGAGRREQQLDSQFEDAEDEFDGEDPRWSTAAQEYIAHASDLDYDVNLQFEDFTQPPALEAQPADDAEELLQQARPWVEAVTGNCSDEQWQEHTRLAVPVAQMMGDLARQTTPEEPTEVYNARYLSTIASVVDEDKPLYDHVHKATAILQANPMWTTAQKAYFLERLVKDAQLESSSL